MSSAYGQTSGILLGISPVWVSKKRHEQKIKASRHNSVRWTAFIKLEFIYRTVIGRPLARSMC